MDILGWICLNHHMLTYKHSVSSLMLLASNETSKNQFPTVLMAQVALLREELEGEKSTPGQAKPMVSEAMVFQSHPKGLKA